MIDKTIFDDIHANLNVLAIDDIKQRLEPLLKGMVVQSPIIEPGTYLYRARKIGPTFHTGCGLKLDDLLYPPANKARLGRANRDNQPMFYCSVGKESLFFEIQDLKPGDELIVTFWRTTERMLVNNIGYTQRVFAQLGAKRVCPSWSSLDRSGSLYPAAIKLPKIDREQLEAVLKSDAHGELRALLSEQFASLCGPNETAKYKITCAIAEAHVGSLDGGAGRFAGLLYPSVRMWANGDNLALQPWFVDAHVKFLKAMHIRIDSCDASSYKISAIWRIVKEVRMHADALNCAVLQCDLATPIIARGWPDDTQCQFDRSRFP